MSAKVKEIRTGKPSLQIAQTDPVIQPGNFNTSFVVEDRGEQFAFLACRTQVPGWIGKNQD
jgi:hypothetical protein